MQTVLPGEVVFTVSKLVSTFRWRIWQFILSFFLFNITVFNIFFLLLLCDVAKYHLDARIRHILGVALYVPTKKSTSSFNSLAFFGLRNIFCIHVALRTILFGTWLHGTAATATATPLLLSFDETLSYKFEKFRWSSKRVRLVWFVHVNVEVAAWYDFTGVRDHRG